MGIQFHNVADAPAQASGYVVFRKQTWSECWEIDDELIPIIGNRLFGAGNIESFTFERAYGPQIRPQGAPVPDDLSDLDRTIADYNRHWVCVKLVVPGNQETMPVTIFVGQIGEASNTIYGSEVKDAADVAQAGGVQEFIAFGPAHILRNFAIHSSVWLNRISGEFVREELGRTFNFNERQGRRRNFGATVGNRSHTKSSEQSFMFGGIEAAQSSLWTHKDIAEYLVAQHLQSRTGEDRVDPEPKRAANGKVQSPFWRIGGPGIGYLDDIAEPVSVGSTIKVADLLAEIISPKRGLDFIIEPIIDDDSRDCGAWEGRDLDEGFEIRVYALHHEPTEWTLRFRRGRTFHYPVNTGSALRIDLSKRHEITSATVAPSSEQLYDGVRIVAAPTIVIADMGALRIGWEISGENPLQNLYKAGDTATPNATSKDHDGARGSDKFRDVYQRFVSDQFDWGALLPNVSLDGVVESPGGVPFQRRHRATLTSLHMKEATDYSVFPPLVQHETQHVPDERPLLVLCIDPESGRLAPIDKMSAMDSRLPNASVSALDNEWGTLLRTSPNHALARNHWPDKGTVRPAASNFDPDTQGLDYRFINVTLAIRSDHSVQLGSDLPDDEQSGHRLIKYIDMPGTRFVFLPPDQVIDIDEQGRVVKSAGPLGNFIEHDFVALAREMPGAIARYLRRRASARIVVNRLETWSGSLGRILLSVQSGGQIQDVKTPITSVEWDFKARTTTIRTGHANK